MSKPSQKERVLKYLILNGKIDDDIAKEEIKVKRASARINELREELIDGWERIETKTITGENEYGKYEYGEYHWNPPTKEDLAEYLKSNRHISRSEAFWKLGMLDVVHKIHELKQSGYQIDTIVRPDNKIYRLIGIDTEQQAMFEPQHQNGISL